MVLTAGASVLLLRHLGVTDFGRYMTVTSLIAIVSSITDAGLTAVGGRDLALRADGAPRRALLRNLLGLRLLVTPVGVLVATAFAIVAGYSGSLVAGTLLAGAGLILAAWQATVVLPLSVELRIGRLTLSEVLRQAATLAGVAVLVIAGAGLEPFFAVTLAVSIVVMALTPMLLGGPGAWRPTFDLHEWRRLVRETLPLAASIVMDTLYFRMLIVLMSLLASAVATGLYATSFRVTDVLYGLVGLIGSTTLPMLTVAAADRERLSYILRRMAEVALIAGSYLSLLVAIVAEPAISLLAGSAYRGAVPVLQVQAFSLIPVCVGTVWSVGLIASRRQSSLMLANGLGLAVVIGLGCVLLPELGAEGGAITALSAEVVFALSLVVSLVRSGEDLRPLLRFSGKPGAATALAAAAAIASGLPGVPAAVVATGVYAAVLALTRAVPRELFDALRPRAGRRGYGSPDDAEPA